MITIYHLGVSQSDRIVWLMEELNLPYKLEWFDRAENGLAPPEYKALHPVATAPVIRDGDIVLGESYAIIEYIINRHANGRLGVSKEQPNYPDYLYWMSYRDSLQANFMIRMFLRDIPRDKEAVIQMDEFSSVREERLFNHIEQRLGESDYLAGPEFTGADIINFFALTTVQMFGGPSMEHLPNVSAYVKRVSQRPAYVKAMEIAGPHAKNALG